MKKLFLLFFCLLFLNSFCFCPWDCGVTHTVYRYACNMGNTVFSYMAPSYYFKQACLAIKAHNIKKLKQALIYYDVNMPNTSGKFLLHYAIKHNFIKGIGHLLRNGALLNVYDPKDRNPLHVAIAYNRPAALLVLYCFGASIIAEDCNNDFPLLVAVEKGSCSIAKILIDLGASVCQISSVDESPIKSAVENNNSAMTQMLLNYAHANKRKKLLKRKWGWQEETLLEISSQNRQMQALLRSYGAS